jgi:hypothetical protein
MTAKAFACQYAGTTNGRRYEMWREEFARQWLSIDFIGHRQLHRQRNPLQRAFLSGFMRNARHTPAHGAKS